MKVYIIRHGQTDLNVERRIIGRIDAPLTTIGKEQAEEARNKLLNKEIDIILCSSLKRTKQTADIINRNRNIPIKYDTRVIERDFGELEGISIDKIDFDSYWDYDKNLHDHNIESIHEMFKRIYLFLDEIKEKYKDKNVLIVTHGGVGMAINCYFLNKIPKGSLRKAGMQLKNCELKEYEM